MSILPRWCEKCGTEHHVDELDAKPDLDWRLWIIKLFLGQLAMLRYAGDSGYDFNRLECSECYGPGYSEM